MTESDCSDLLNQTFVSSPEAIASNVGNETVMLHLGNSTYYGLDPVGTIIWNGIRSGRSVEDIRAEILSTYDVTEEVVDADLRRLLGELLDHEILVIS